MKHCPECNAEYNFEGEHCPSKKTAEEVQKPDPGLELALEPITEEELAFAKNFQKLFQKGE